MANQELPPSDDTSDLGRRWREDILRWTVALGIPGAPQPGTTEWEEALTSFDPRPHDLRAPQHREMTGASEFNSSQETETADACSPSDNSLTKKEVVLLAIGLLLGWPIALVVIVVVMAKVGVFHGVAKGLGDRLNSLAEYRNGALVFVAVAYVIGYLVWSFHSLQQHLGLLPALRPQYILAGVPPIVLFGSIAAITILASSYNGGQSRFFTVLLLGGTTGVAMMSAVYLWYALGWWPATAYLVLTFSIAVTGAMFGGLGILPITIPWAGVSLSLLLVALYVTVLYPSIPQEFGGVRPRCVYLDVKTASVGRDLRTELDAATVSPEKAIQRTKQVSILFTGADSLIVQPRARLARRHVFSILDTAVADSVSC